MLFDPYPSYHNITRGHRAIHYICICLLLLFSLPYFSVSSAIYMPAQKSPSFCFPKADSFSFSTGLLVQIKWANNFAHQIWLLWHCIRNWTRAQPSRHHYSNCTVPVQMALISMLHHSFPCLLETPLPRIFCRNSGSMWYCIKKSLTVLIPWDPNFFMGCSWFWYFPQTPHWILQGWCIVFLAWVCSFLKSVLYIWRKSFTA